MINKKLILLGLALICPVAASAVQAWRSPIAMRQPDGSEVHVLLHGDEFCHMQTTVDGYALLRDAEGVLRYATLLPDGHWSTEGAPAAREVSLRSAQEQAYLLTLEKVTLEKLSSVLARQASRSEASHSARARVVKVPVEQMHVGNFPVKDSINAVVLLAEFNDVPFTYTLDYYQNMMNQPGFSYDGEIGSVRDYFLEQSGGLFRPNFDVFGPIHLSHSMAYYGSDGFNNRDDRVQLMIKETCELAADRLGCDFSRYDNDQDGEVDMVYVIFSGYGQHAGGGDNAIWPHKYQLDGYDFKVERNGKLINVYACSSEMFLYPDTRSSSIGNFCHEFSHVLGLADHYNTMNSSIYNFGQHDVMDYGNYNNDARCPVAYSAFERASLGWMELEEIDQPQKDVVLQDLKQGGKAYRISTHNPNEFFILENRQQSGYDTYLPDEGLMITHVDYDRSFWDQNIVNDDPTHCRYLLCAADGQLSYSNNNRDLFPISGHNSFTDNTRPGSLAWDGTPTDRWVSNIRINRTDDIIVFDFMPNHLLAPHALPATDITTTGFIACWEAVADATSYDLHLLHYTLEAEAKLALEENFDKMTQGTYSSPDPIDVSAELNDYTHTPGWSGEQVYQADGCAKLGSVNVTGWLQTPPLNLSHFDGIYTVVLEVQANTGKTPVFTLMADGNTAKHRLSDKPKQYLYVMQGGQPDTQLRFEVQRERAYINSITVLRGDVCADYPDAQPMSVSYAAAAAPSRAQERDLSEYQAEEVEVFQGIRALNYVITSLEPDGLYAYQVEAVGSGSKRSILSNEVLVDLATGLGIETLATEPVSAPGDNFDLWGRRGVRRGFVVDAEGRKCFFNE